MIKHTEIGLGSTVAVSVFMDSHPLAYKVACAVMLAVVSTVASQATQRFFPRKQT